MLIHRYVPPGYHLAGSQPDHLQWYLWKYPLYNVLSHSFRSYLPEKGTGWSHLRTPKYVILRNSPILSCQTQSGPTAAVFSGRLHPRITPQPGSHSDKDWYRSAAGSPAVWPVTFLPIRSFHGKAFPKRFLPYLRSSSGPYFADHFPFASDQEALYWTPM